MHFDTYSPIRGMESGKYFWKKSNTSVLVRSFSNSSKGMNKVHVKDLFCEKKRNRVREKSGFLNRRASFKNQEAPIRNVQADKKRHHHFVPSSLEESSAKSQWCSWASLLIRRSSTI